MSPLEITQLATEVSQLRDYLHNACQLYRNQIAGLHPNYWQSAHNLIAYMALRQRDLRELQTKLSQQGFSSLGRSEAHVLASIDAVLQALAALSDYHYESDDEGSKSPDFSEGAALLDAHSLRLFGPKNQEQYTHIMVTMPPQAASQYKLVESLLLNGMDCMRINCAHDDPHSWKAMIENLRLAQQQLSLPCKISMDLAGPKLRTTAITPSDDIIKIKPLRNQRGEVVSTAHILLVPEQASSGIQDHIDVSIIVPRTTLALLDVGDTLRFKDARGAKRDMTVIAACADYCIAELSKTAYLSRDGIYKIIRGDTRVGKFQSKKIRSNDPYIVLQRGNRLTICRNPDPHVANEIGCTLPQILDQVKVGESVWFDDGKIGAQVEHTALGRVELTVTYAAAEGSKLRADKGINLPDSHLDLPSLSAKDLRDLDFVAEHADIVALSFANNVADVRALCDRLRELGRESVSVVLKIETPQGFQNLVPMLLEAMTMESCGVMIARGDLAIEVGFERLAEVQEEILWICEAAHVPVIWATQVLENLAKYGAPTRAEISDAAMGHRADCVMLNKGDHIAEALLCLRDILKRMETHEYKKHSRMRPLNVANSVFPLQPISDTSETA